VLADYPKESRYEYMVRDASRYMPILKDCEYVRSHFEVKTVMQANEVDDGRPILFRRDPLLPALIHVMGSAPLDPTGKCGCRRILE
jgi:hypothetical protein